MEPFVFRRMLATRRQKRICLRPTTVSWRCHRRSRELLVFDAERTLVTNDVELLYESEREISHRTNTRNSEARSPSIFFTSKQDCWVWCSCSGDYTEFHPLECTAVQSGENQPIFRKNMLLEEQAKQVISMKNAGIRFLCWKVSPSLLTIFCTFSSLHCYWRSVLHFCNPSHSVLMGQVPRNVVERKYYFVIYVRTSIELVPV
jgi:hypothetical protein